MPIQDGSKSVSPLIHRFYLKPFFEKSYTYYGRFTPDSVSWQYSSTIVNYSKNGFRISLVWSSGRLVERVERWQGSGRPLRKSGGRLHLFPLLTPLLSEQMK